MQVWKNGLMGNFITIMLCIGMGLTACTQPTPIVIYVTATFIPQTEASTHTITPIISVTPLHTSTSTVASTKAPTPTATLTPTPLPTTTPIASASPTNVPTQTLVPTPIGTEIPGMATNKLGVQSVVFVEQHEWNEILERVETDLQFQWLKIQVAWDSLQPNSADEITESFRRLEIYIEQARQMRQIRVLLSIAKAPDWSRSNLAEDGPPDDPQQLARFLNLILGEFGQAIDAIEIWNEPNLLREWQGQPLSGASYMRYFDVAYQTIHAYSPQILVITAGLAPTGDSEYSVDDHRFLREMYQSGLGNYDHIGIGVHPYGWGNPPDARCCNLDDERGWDDSTHFFFIETLETYRNIMIENGDQNHQLWLTEVGWATWDRLSGEPPQVWMGYNDVFDQGHYTIRAIEIGNSLDYVGGMFLWNLNFGLPVLVENRDERVAYSMTISGANPVERPVYWMIYDAVRPMERLNHYEGRP